MKTLLNIVSALTLFALCSCGEVSVKKDVPPEAVLWPVSDASVTRALPEALPPSGLPEVRTPLAYVTTGAQTGPKDWQGSSDPDGLFVVVEPCSSEGRLIQAPGYLRFHLYEKDQRHRDRKGRLLLTWIASPEELARHWKQGPFGGYEFHLHWGKKPPKARFAVLETHFITTDGKEYVTKDTSLPIGD
jgi:hypothetical protein